MEQKRTHLWNIGFNKVQRDLEYDCCIWNGTLGRVHHVGIDQDALSGSQLLRMGFHCDGQSAGLNINDLDRSVSVRGNITAIIDRSIKTYFGCDRSQDDLMRCAHIMSTTFTE